MQLIGTLRVVLTCSVDILGTLLSYSLFLFSSSKTWEHAIDMDT